jgi:hypothetical protein
MNMERLRKAILALATEDVETIGELTSDHEELVAAFNAAGPFPGHPEVKPITDEDMGIT